MENYLNVLRACPLFAGIQEENLKTMLNCLNTRTAFFDKKYTILAEGNPAKHIGIMLSGSAQIIQLDYYGNRSILSEVTAGEMFGEAFACAEVPALPVAVVADTPCEVMLIASDHILNNCANRCGFHQQMIYNLMKDLAEKALRFHQKIEVIAKRSTREKLMTYLALEAKKADSNTFEIPFDRQELADYLEVDRSGLSSEIGKLRREGILDNHRNRFRLL